MKKLFFLTIMAVAMLFSSCDKKNNSDLITTQTLPGCVAFITDAATSATTLSGDISYTIDLNYTKATAKVVINNLATPDGMLYPVLTFEDLKLTSDEKGWVTISAATAMPNAGSSTKVPIFDNLKIRLLQRNFGGSYSPALIVNFALDAKYEVVSTPSIQYLAGKTVTTSRMSQPFESTATVYGLRIDSKTNKLTLAISNATFIQAMPAINFQLQNIDFKFNGAGVDFTVDAITPVIGTAPNDKFPITDVIGTYNFADGLTMSYKCDPATVPGVSFSVQANTNYFDSYTTID